MVDHPLRILCVDDNADVADTTAALLEVLGYDAVACYGGVRALGLVDEFRPEVCLLDLNMPFMDGCELAQRIRDRTENTPLLIAVTAMGTEEARERTAAAGFDRHLVKPFDPFQLIGVLGERFGNSA